MAIFNNITSWVVLSVIFGTVAMLGALGETINEKVGHLNLGVPGIMYLSGFLSYISVYSYESNTANPNGFVVILVAFLVAITTGAIMGLIYCLMCVTFKANQNVVGLATTAFGVGFGKFLSYSMNVNDAKASFSAKIFSASFYDLFSSSENVIGANIGRMLVGYGFMTYVAIIILVLAFLFFKKTKYGLNIRAIGESPSTADSVGISVFTYKYITTMVGCAICALGGMTFVLYYGNGAWTINNNIESIGWLCVSLVIFASWKPLNIIWGSILFGFLFWAYNYLPGVIPMPNIIGINELLRILPYIITLVILIINSARKKKDNQPPASLGLAYDREERD